MLWVNGAKGGGIRIKFRRFLWSPSTCYSNPQSVVEDDGGPQPTAAQNIRGEKIDVTNHLGLL
ncbi:hypothetical protein [Oscillatoria sp. HE19RPO]|uniref:hypothetical protein n=1 Tax=Oscillatoria sp. HE19RPO TaxID=2954806 RepID=UPI0020C46B44|nr:hypothetical protein [Oscillatoria sp. HE19RPO]